MSAEDPQTKQNHATRRAALRAAAGKAPGLEHKHDLEEYQGPGLFLAKTPPYNQLTERERRSVAAAMTWEVYPPGRVIIRKGDTVSDFYLIRKGLVSVSLLQKGRETTLTTLTEGDCFGEMSLLSGGVTTATVTAVKETLCLRQGQREFVKTIEQRPAVQKFFTALVIERMRGAYKRLLPDTPQKGEHPLAETVPLRVYALGHLEILKQGEPLTFGRKAQKKPLALLVALIALGGRQVSEERLTEFIWPDLDGGAAHDVLETTLRRLRRLLGEKAAVEMRAGKVSLSSRHLWIDTWAFEQVCDEADRLWKAGISSGLIDCLHKAFWLYRGPFLTFEEEFWVLSLRERLRNRFIRVVLRLGSCLEQQDTWAEAAECYEKGLGIDDTVEEFYQRLITVHQKQGRSTEAAIVYERCRKTLHANLGTTPSAKTDSQAAKLLSEPRSR
jgi:DNA-binding SARP family transcriptional activator